MPIKVLIADDHPLIADGIKNAIEKDNSFKVKDVVTNGRETLEYLKNNTIDILLLDIDMPIMNGIEFLVAIKKIEKYSRIPIIIHTTSSSAEDYFKCKTLGVCGYFVKHIDFKEYKKNLILITEYWMRSYTNRT